MNTRQLNLPLSGFGTPSTEAEVEVGRLSLGLSLAVIPTPLVHFAVPPVALVTGVVVGIRRALQNEIITRATGPCPFCGAEQTLGLTGAPFRFPRDLKCHSCRQPFTIAAA